MSGRSREPDVAVCPLLAASIRGPISGCEPVQRPGSGTARATTGHVRTPTAPNPGIWRRWRNGLRRGGGAGRHPAPRRRALAPVHRRGAPQVGENLVDHSGLGNDATMRISCPQRGQNEARTRLPSPCLAIALSPLAPDQTPFLIWPPGEHTPVWRQGCASTPVYLDFTALGAGLSAQFRPRARGGSAGLHSS